MKCCTIPEIVTDFSCLASHESPGDATTEATSPSLVRKKRDDSEVTTPPKIKKKSKIFCYINFKCKVDI
jgi:hypothetical protein